MSNVKALQKKFGLSATHAKILLLLVEKPEVTSGDIELDYGLTSCARVAICRMRQRLSDAGVNIKSQRDVGYWLEPDDRSKLVDLMQGGQTTRLPVEGTS